MQIDFSKGTALHRLYGHETFVLEARKNKKPESFIQNICANLKCDGQPARTSHWRANLDAVSERRSIKDDNLPIRPIQSW